MTDKNHRPPAKLRIRRIGIDTYQEPVIYMREDCHVCRSEGFEAQARIQLELNGNRIIATLNVITSEILAPSEAGLSESAWRLLNAREGEEIILKHPHPLESLSHVRAKVYGKRLEESAMQAIVADIAGGRYSDVHLASFITACAAGRLDHHEMLSLARSMINVGDCIQWETRPVMDKHCVGGLPGNRTTLLVVPIVAAFGLVIPKTSSRAITSPAGTADTMETLAPVELTIPEMRKIVEKEGGCIAWGGAMQLSPADDVMIRVERPLNLDSEGQLVASVLSKKVAAGSTHVIVDIPVGPTAKVRSPEAAQTLASSLLGVGQALGLEVSAVISDGSQPVGWGVGPALEARDVLAILRGEPSAPEDLKERALLLAGEVLELSGEVAQGRGEPAAREILESGRALKKFEAICEAQGGMREPPVAPNTHTVEARRRGRVMSIDNREIARVARLAGAPRDPQAGLDVHVKIGDEVEIGMPLLTLHANSPGELNYALDYVNGKQHLIGLDQDGVVSA